MSEIIYLASEEWVTNIISGLTGPTGSTTGFDGTGTQYLSVFGKSDPVTNIAELQNVYNVAKALAPTSDNPVNIIIYPGYYGTYSSALILDTPYINLISSTGNIDVEIGYYGTSINSDYITLYGIKFQDGGITINDNYPNLYIENCYIYSGEQSIYPELSGTFKNIIGESDIFNGFPKYSGTFENINSTGTALDGYTASEYSGTFKNINIVNGFYGTIFSGIFENINIQNGFNINFATTFSGTFKNINIKYQGFYNQYLNNYSGSFKDIYGSSIFNGNSIYSGTFENISTYEVPIFNGTLIGIFNNCIGSSGSFNCTTGTSIGTFNNCIGSYSSFNNLSGNLNYCIGNSGSFDNVQSGSILNNCISDIVSFNNINGKLNNCILLNGTFDAPLSGGTLNNCIDGNGKIIGGPTISGVYYQEVTGVTSVTVSLDSPLNNTGYTINITPASLDSAIQYYITNLTLSSFDIIYVSTITGIISFYWIINKS